MKSNKIIHALSLLQSSSHRFLPHSSSSARRLWFSNLILTRSSNLHGYALFCSHFLHSSLTPTTSLLSSSSLTVRLASTSSSEDNYDEATAKEEIETIEEWEEEDEAESEIGDGGDGGGIVLQGVPWGEQVLSIANEVLLQFGDDMKLYAFKATPRGYIYVRLDKLSDEYGCPNMDELERYSVEYKKRLDEVGALREIPDDLGLEVVSTPGAERILKVPDDLCRYKDMPLRVCYLEDCAEKNGVLMLESTDREAEKCVWKLADARENRDPQSKGRPLSRKQKEWRLRLSFLVHKKVTLYFDY